jgi:O-glycosyl hydrolase
MVSSLFVLPLLSLPWYTLALPSSPGHGYGHQTLVSPSAVTIDTSKSHQTIRGFGFSSAFQRSSQIHGKDGLSPTNTSYVLELLFSRTNGMGSSILRNGIGSSLDTSRDYMNSIAPQPPIAAPGQPLWEGEMQYNFDGNDTDQLWLAQQAYSFGVRDFYASAWSAPWYMKSNRNDTNGGYLCGVRDIPTNTDITGIVNQCEPGETWVQKYAEYLAQYVQFYKEAGIEIGYVGWTNEPDLNVTYASMHSDGYQAGQVGVALRAELDKRGMGNVKTACCEATGWQQQQTMLAEMATLPDAADSLDVITGHGYSSAPKLPLEIAGVKKETWQSEWADLDGDWRTGWDVLGKAGEGLVWANIVHDALTISDVSGFLFWQGAESASTNSALIRLDGDQVFVSKRLWAMGMFSRWVRPGATRVDVDVGSLYGLVAVSAYVNSDGGEGEGAGKGETVVVAINNAHWDMELSLNGLGGGKSVSQFMTNNYYNATEMGPLSVDGAGKLDVVLPERSMVTFVM